jgi:hypothetical protein
MHRGVGRSLSSPRRHVAGDRNGDDAAVRVPEFGFSAASAVLGPATRRLVLVLRGSVVIKTGRLR